MQDGYSFFFRTDENDYSDAFAGRGEASIARIVRNVSRLRKPSLILLDEPETSLHIEAQQRLLDYLVKIALKRGHQIVFATHSLSLLQGLPQNAIKCLSIEADGCVRIRNNSSPEEAVFYLGGQIAASDKKIVFVEDELAKYIVKKVLENEGAGFAQRFRVEVLAGGADSAIGRVLAPSFASKRVNILFLFDGDKKTGEYEHTYNQYPTASAIPTAKDCKLVEIVKRISGQNIQHFANGSNGLADAEGKIEFYRGFYDYFRKHVRFLPFDLPERYILSATQCDTSVLSGPEVKILWLKHLALEIHDESLLDAEMIRRLSSSHFSKNVDFQSTEITTISKILREFGDALT